MAMAASAASGPAYSFPAWRGRNAPKGKADAAGHAAGRWTGATLQELHASAAIAALFRGVAAFNLAGEILSTLFPEGAEGRASGVSVAPGKDK